jgi:hypothetical protein
MTSKLILLAAVPALMASVAFAQQPQGAAPGTPPSAGTVSPAEWHNRMCTERFARTSGRLAYLEAELSLTDQQRPAFAKFRQAAVAGAEKMRSMCLETAPKSATPPTVVEREAQMEKMLTARLETLKESRPALQALYEVLTPAQRSILDHAGHHGRFFARRGMPSGFGGPARGPGFGPGMKGPGMMGPGMMGPDGQ